MKKILFSFCFLAVLSLQLFSQNSTVPAITKLEVKFINREQYDYYLIKNPNAERNTFVDETGEKLLVLSEIEGLIASVKNQDIKDFLNKKNVSKSIVYVSTINATYFGRTTPYFISYDENGNYTITE